jgi:apolipoprotein N-acyltransferase
MARPADTIDIGPAVEQELAPDTHGGTGELGRGGAGWHGARRLLRGTLRPLVGGQSLGQMGDGVAQIAFAQLVLFEAGKGATPWELTKLLAVTLLPFCVVGPFAGVVIDRWDRRRTMVFVSALRVAVTVVAVGMLALHSQPLAYVGIVLLLSSSRFVLTAKGAALPRTVPPDDLVTANAISSIAGLSATFVGAVAAATFVETWPAAGFVAAAGLYVAAGIVFSRLPFLGGGEAPAPMVAGLRRAAEELGEEVHTVVHVEAVRRPLVAVWTFRFLVGAGFALLVLIADARYGLETSGYGLAIAATGVGAFLGTWIAPVLARQFRPAQMLPVSFVVAGTAALLGGFDPELAVLVPAIAVAAFAFQVLKVFVDALVGNAAPDLVRGRVFSAYDVLYNVSFVLAALVLVPLWEPSRERVLLWWLGVAFLASAGVLAHVTRTWPFRSRVRSERTRSAWKGRALALGAGALLAPAFPEPAWWWLGFVGLVPVVLVVVAAPTGREAAMRAWMGGTGYFVAVHHWLIPNAGPFIVPLGMLLGLLWMLWGRLAWAFLARPVSTPRVLAAVVLVPAAWVVAEYARAWDKLGGPFGLLGASQWNDRAVLSLASVGGVWAVSFVLVAVNVAIAAALRASPWGAARAAAVGAAVVLVAAGPLWWSIRPDPVSGATVRVAGVQPGVTHSVGPRFDASEAATVGLTSSRYGLVVWGESSVGLDPERHPEYLERVEAASRAVGADIVVNVDARSASGRIRKTSMLVGPDGIRGRYDKMRLVPFGEYIPLRPLFLWVALLPRAPLEDRHHGTNLVLLRSHGLRIGPLICFESAFPDLTRRLTRMGAQLLLVQSSTSTFQDSWGPEQHASLAAVRAMETGRPVLQATLTGVSAAFDGSARRLLWYGTDRRGVYEVDIPLGHGVTPYVRLGEWVPAASYAALLIAAIVAGMRAARRQPSRPVDVLAPPSSR